MRGRSRAHRCAIRLPGGCLAGSVHGACLDRMDGHRSLPWRPSVHPQNDMFYIIFWRGRGRGATSHPPAPTRSPREDSLVTDVPTAPAGATHDDPGEAWSPSREGHPPSTGTALESTIPHRITWPFGPTGTSRATLTTPHANPARPAPMNTETDESTPRSPRKADDPTAKNPKQRSTQTAEGSRDRAPQRQDVPPTLPNGASAPRPAIASRQRDLRNAGSPTAPPTGRPMEGTQHAASSFSTLEADAVTRRPAVRRAHLHPAVRCHAYDPLRDDASAVLVAA